MCKLACLMYLSVILVLHMIDITAVLNAEVAKVHTFVTQVKVFLLVVKKKAQVKVKVLTTSLLK